MCLFSTPTIITKYKEELCTFVVCTVLRRRACRSDGELMGCVRESGFNGRCRDGFTHFSIQFSSTVLLCTPLVADKIFAKSFTCVVLHCWNCKVVLVHN